MSSLNRQGFEINLELHVHSQCISFAVDASEWNRCLVLEESVLPKSRYCTIFRNQCPGERNHLWRTMCDHGLAAIFVLTAMTSSSANIPSALDVKFPLAYMQSSFVTGHSDGVDCPGQGIMWQTLTSEERLDRLRRYALNSTSFRGGEMFINTMETAAARADVREMNRLILQVLGVLSQALGSETYQSTDSDYPTLHTGRGRNENRPILWILDPITYPRHVVACELQHTAR